MPTPSRILVIGDGGSPTGYARVIRNILRNLPQDAYDIHHLAVHYSGDPHEETWKLYPAAIGGDIFGINRIPEMLERLRPELVFAAADLWVQARYLDTLNGAERKAKVVVYSPVDAGPVDPDWVQLFRSVSRIVVFTRYARSEILNALGTDDLPRVDVIPIGVDRDVFFPLSPTEPWRTVEAKRRLKLFAEEETESSFVVLNAHRNQPRKRIDITLKGFAAFARGKPKNVQLYLHMGIEDAGWNVLKLAKRYGIDERLILTQNRGMPSIDSEQLNMVYNACDVGINTATGEGWGLPSFEHAATGKAQVVPSIGTLAEIWNECAEFIEPVGEVVYEGVLSEGKVVDPEGVASALGRLYADRAYRQRVAENCYRRATRPDYQWDSIGRLWDSLFQEVVGERESHTVQLA